MSLGPLSWRRLAALAAIFVAAGVVLVLLAHAPFVRGAVLRRAASTVEERLGLRLEADRLDYNLAALRIGMANLRVSALHSPDEPFVTADYLSVTLPWRALLGDVAVDDVSVTNARVFVRRREDGTSNLPAASGTPGGEPAPLPIQRLDIPRLAVDVRDEQRTAFLWIPSMAVLLTPDDGYVRLREVAELNTETQITHISQLNGEASFDGRSLRLRDLEARMDEGTARLDGSLTVIARDPAVEIDLSGSLDVTRVARWFVVNGELPRGEVRFEAEVAGPFDELDTRLNLTSEQLSWSNLTATDLASRARITTDAADVQELSLGFAGGRATATGSIPFGPDGKGEVSASWTGVDMTAAITALAPDADVAPSGMLAGELAARGTGADPARWSGSVRMTMADGRNATGRVAVSGNAAVEFDRRNWRFEGRHLIGGVAPVMAALRGDPDGRFDGSIEIAETDLPGVARILRAAGIADIPDDSLTSGTLEGDIGVTGALADPSIEGRTVVRNLAAAQVDVPLLQVDVSGRALRPQLEFAAEAPEAAVADQPLQQIRTTGRISNRQLVIDGLSASQPSAAGRLTASGTYDIDTSRYSALLEGSQWALMPTENQPLAASVDLRFMGEGSTDQPRGTGSVTVRNAMWRDIALGSLDASIELDGGAAHIEARAPEFSASASGSVDLESPYQARLDAIAQELNLSGLLQRLHIETPATVAGTTTVTLDAELPLQMWRRGSATLTVGSLKATAGDLPVETIGEARVRYENERAYVERLDVAVGGVTLSASGSLPVFEAAGDGSAVLLTATGNVDDVVRGATALGLTDLPVTGGDGAVALLSRVTGALQQPVVAADLEIGPASVTLEGAPPVTGLRVRAHAEDGTLELREGEASWEGAALSASGRAPLSMFNDRLAAAAGAASGGRAPEAAALRARATNVSPAVLAPFVEPGALAELSGSMDVILDVASPTLDPTDLTGELRIDRFDFRVADLPVGQRLPTSIVVRDGFARVEAWEWVGEGTTLTVRGQVRMEDRQAAILANGSVDLRLLTPFLRDAGVTTAGRLEPRLSIVGTLDNPRVDGDAIVTDGELRLADPRVIVSELAMRAILSRTTARVAQLTGSVNGGPLTGDGTVEYSADRGLEAALSTAIRGMALDYPAGLRSELDADLSVALHVPPGDSGGTPSGKVSGDVTVLRGAYREPMAVVAGLLATLRAQQLNAAVAPSPFLDALALDVRIVTDEDVFVDNNYARVQLGADLRLIGTVAAPALSGRAELREGGQLFVGRNVYTVNVGAIDFANPVAIEPNLNVEATTRAGGEDIQVTITGLAESPTVELRSTSNPDLGQAEIASLLLTGRRLETLSSADAAFIGTQVLGNFSAEALGFASRAVGLDTLRLGGVETQTLRRDPTEVATTREDPTNRITFGKTVAPNLDLTFSQSLRDGDAQTWIVDYLPRRGLELRLVSDDDDMLSSGFRHDVAFGAGGRAGQPRAQAPAPTVVRVDVSGDLGLPEARVRDVLRLGPGDRFDFAEWQDDRDRLESLYRSEGYLAARLTARRAEEADGLVLAYSIAAGPPTRIEATGIELDSSLRSRLETAWFQSVFDGFLVDEARQIVRDELARRGYLQPRIDVRLLEEGAAKTLRIDVEPGARSARVTVRIEGAAEPLAAEISAHLQERGLIERAVLEPEAVAREVATYLRARGHARAQATAGAPLFVEGIAELPVRVDPGQAVIVAGVRFEGTLSLQVAALRDAAALDQEVPYDPAVIEAARGRLVALYRREGFFAATVRVRSNLAEDGPFVDITFLVEEGPRQVLEEISVVGNRAIDADVVLSALDLSIGEPLRTDDALQARTRVFETGLFRRVDVTSEPAERAAATDSRVPIRLRVTVDEWPSVRLRYGFIVAEERPEDDLDGRELVPGFSGDVTRRTIFGRAITLGAAVDVARRNRLARAFAAAPTLFGLGIESSLSLDAGRRQLTTGRVDNRRGVSFEQRIRPRPQFQLSYAYRFERSVTELAPDPFLGPQPPAVLNIARLTGNAAWDTRNDPADTTRGLLASSSFEFAPESLGSDIRFVRQLAQAYYFRPWRDAVFASAARVGVAVPLEGQRLSLDERFLAGGSRTVRGVAENSLGPSDFLGPLGGEMMMVFNQEARLPVYRWMRAVAFIDAGNVFERPGDASLVDLVGSVGLGLRVATPFALLRVDYGKVVWGQSPSPSGRWTFGIGQIF